MMNIFIIVICIITIFSSSTSLSLQLLNSNQTIINENNNDGNVSVISMNKTSSTSTTSLPLLFGSYIFDPHVQAQCERNLMNIIVTFDQSFNGIVHVRNYRRNPCQVYGNGSTIVTMTIDLLASSNRLNFCGVHRVKGSEERSISLVVRLHRALELSDDKHFVITCGNTEFSNRNKNEKLIFKFVDRHGHKITKLYHGESYRLRAEIMQQPHQNQNLQQQKSSLLFKMNNNLQSSSSSSSSYHLYVKNCFIFNGNDTDIELLNNNGCPTMYNVQMLSSFKQIGHNIAEAEIYSMFKLPGTNQLHIQCLIELIDNCKFCDQSLCQSIVDENNNNNNNLTKNNYNTSIQIKSDMQMLASTTVYVFEPDQQMSSSIMLAGIHNFDDNNNNNNGIIHYGQCNEWRFPWLIALCIMLGILLIIMMIVNIFLCTSMSCSCFRSEMVEHEPTIIDDYDPYKIDIGSYYSPYDSRLSLNRSTTSIANPMTSNINNNNHHQHNIHPIINNGDRSGSYYFSQQQQQQPLHHHSQHHNLHHIHNHHNNNNNNNNNKPISSICSSYSPSTTDNTNHSSRPGAKLINDNNKNNKHLSNENDNNKNRNNIINKNNNKINNNNKPIKNRQQKPKNLKSSSSSLITSAFIPLNNGNHHSNYNPYHHHHHSPQSYRSDDFF